MPPRLSALFHLSPSFDPTHRFTTSSLLFPLSLGLARALIATYGVTTIIVSLALRHQSSAAQPSPAQSFSYFSTITWWGITSYHAFAALHTLAYARTGRAPLERWWAGLQVAHSVLWSTIAVFPLLVTVIFWGVQYRPARLDTRLGAWSDVSHHALNSVFAVFEIVFARAERMPWIHAPVLVVLLAGYAGIAYITHDTEGFYTYGFLDPTKRSRGMLAGIIVGMGALVVVLFAVVWGLVWLRLWVFEVKLGLTGKMAEADGERLGSVISAGEEQDGEGDDDREKMEEGRLERTV